MVFESIAKDCGGLRPTSEFTRDRSRPDGLSFYCRKHARRRVLQSKDARKGPPKSRHPRETVVPAGSKWCPDCSTVEPLDQFVRNAIQPSGWAPYCRPCHNARGRAAKDMIGGSRTYHLKRRYGISAEEADAMLGMQSGMCAICKVAPAIHVDHDHATGAVRALLCFNCNGGLGQFEDDPQLLHAAAYYVQFHTLRQEALAAQDAPASAPDGPSRPGEPPVGSQRRPGARANGTRSTGRISGARRRTQAGEADG